MSYIEGILKLRVVINYKKILGYGLLEVKQ